ncbi:hypothetical protein M404DRAFT_434065 [Pisolithus tinctorius Marx 270]|uniref:Uncharacterized protein n=1 Tax=Pisolithus tinctorius Marx 270 TaxID=870435 RepID=A0A0C3PF68_PISTI|nr:hypothetical protein M404DRAFT_434065 [Pisolithus tinctorius Marx 270]
MPMCSWRELLVFHRALRIRFEIMYRPHQSFAHAFTKPSLAMRSFRDNFTACSNIRGPISSHGLNGFQPYQLSRYLTLRMFGQTSLDLVPSYSLLRRGSLPTFCT